MGGRFFWTAESGFRFKNQMILESPIEPSREELIALIAAQAAEIAALKARIAELERRLGLNSSNSGKPPSSDGLKKPARVTQPARTFRARNRAGRRVTKARRCDRSPIPTKSSIIIPPACAECGAALTPDTSAGHSARQVFDLPEPQPLVVTEHRAHDCQCAACGATTRAAVS